MSTKCQKLVAYCDGCMTCDKTRARSKEWIVFDTIKPKEVPKEVNIDLITKGSLTQNLHVAFLLLLHNKSPSVTLACLMSYCNIPKPRELLL